MFAKFERYIVYVHVADANHGKMCGVVPFNTQIKPAVCNITYTKCSFLDQLLLYQQLLQKQNTIRMKMKIKQESSNGN